MGRIKVLTIIGARPQFIKAAVVNRYIRNERLNVIQETIVHTGQHFDINMSDIFFEQMDIPRPQYHLNINGMSHGAMTGQMLEKIESIIIDVKPDCVLVYGDTNSTLAGALAAKKLHVKLAHVEAGLRSYNLKMPEEINRIVTDRISDYLFCPTEQAAENLNNEGFGLFNTKIIITGDVMYDAALFYASQVKMPLIKLNEKFALCTLHRAENTDDTCRLQSILDALSIISNDCQIVMPLHPRTRNVIDSKKLKINKNIFVIEPLGYFEMLYLLKKCYVVMTDSGGLQKEAYFFKKPCLTMRDETEWVELVRSKVNFLVGSNQERIVHSYYGIAEKDLIFDKQFYGDGNAGKSIVEHIIKDLL